MSTIDFASNDFSEILHSNYETLESLYGAHLAKQELMLEHESYLDGEYRFRKLMDSQVELGDVANSQIAKPLLNMLIPKFLTEWDEWVKDSEEKRGKKQTAYNLIKDVQPEVAAVITIKVTLACLTRDKYSSIQQVTSQIGRAIEDELRYSRIRDEESKYFYQVVKPGLDKRVGKHYKKAYIQTLESKLLNEERLEEQWVKWTPQQHIHAGVRLLEILINSSNMVMVCRSNKGNVQKDGEFVQLTPQYVEVLKERAQALAGISPIYQPCVVPPKDWDGIKGGGYWAKGNKPTVFIRAGSRKALLRYKNVHMPKVYNAVNIAQRTPWRVNKEVLAVVNEIINWKNIDLDDIPSVDPAPLPERPLDIDTNPEALKQWKKEATFVYRMEKSRISKRLRLEAIVAQANKFKDYDKIYFPMNLDWRGRVYAIPLFNPQGNDLTKGLLTFANSKPIGEEGFFWLKIHGANTAGVDKIDFDLRLKFIEDNHERILSVAGDPLSNLWWLEVDAPFCFLAFCFEYANVCKYGLEYKCSLPVSFDGSCSGVQHLSAMLKDEIGGFAVNLVPSEEVQDLYKIVADEVITYVEKDLREGSETIKEPYCDEKTGEITERLILGDKALAKQWSDYGISRKVTKRSCMTLPYGSKEYGFKDQILEDTIVPAIASGEGIMFTHPAQAASYMAHLIWKAVTKKVVAAVKVMKWLQAAAGLLAAEIKDPKTGDILRGRCPIHWVTPDGFPVWQEYRVQVQKRLNLMFLGQFRLQPTVNTQAGQIDARKQKIAFSPNFTHSMDGTHLRETVNYAYNAYNIKDFALIHDSFGTLPTDAGNLFKAIREAFVDMYVNNDVLADFYEQFADQLHISQLDKMPMMPEKGNLKIEDIVNSKFAFA